MGKIKAIEWLSKANKKAKKNLKNERKLVKFMGECLMEGHKSFSHYSFYLLMLVFHRNTTSPS